MDGRIEQRQIDQLKQMGDWLKVYGGSIYGTSGGPYTPNPVFSATRKGNNVYVHLFDTSKKEIILPALPGVKVLNTSLMNGGQVQLKENNGQYLVSLPVQFPNAVSNVLVLKLDKTAGEIPVISVESK